MKKLLTITGMACGTCGMRVKADLEAIRGITDVKVDAFRGTALVEAEEFSSVLVERAIRNAGFTLAKIV